MILRILTGSKLRYIVNGCLVEEAGESDDKDSISPMQREISAVKNDVAELKGMVKVLLERR